MREVDLKDITITINLSMLPYSVVKTLIELSNGVEEKFPFTLVAIIDSLHCFLTEHYEEYKNAKK